MICSSYCSAFRDTVICAQQEIVTMIKIATLKEIQLSNAPTGHLLLIRQQGPRFAILVHGPDVQPEPAIGLMTLAQSPMLRCLRPDALDTVCVDLGPLEIVISPELETYSSGPQKFVPGTLIF